MQITLRKVPGGAFLPLSRKLRAYLNAKVGDFVKIAVLRDGTLRLKRARRAK